MMYMHINNYVATAFAAVTAHLGLRTAMLSTSHRLDGRRIPYYLLAHYRVGIHIKFPNCKQV